MPIKHNNPCFHYNAPLFAVYRIHITHNDPYCHYSTPLFAAYRIHNDPYFHYITPLFAAYRIHIKHNDSYFHYSTLYLQHTEYILNIVIPIIVIVLFLGVMVALYLTPTVGSPQPGPRRISQGTPRFELSRFVNPFKGETFRRVSYPGSWFILMTSWH